MVDTVYALGSGGTTLGSTTAAASTTAAPTTTGAPSTSTTGVAGSTATGQKNKMHDYIKKSLYC